ncbi:N-acetylmuramoyl-L-alanine amidase [uncultured Oscillibacter sp.]|uniref:N-acetylmuramoyl-L-alanine amidase n=1 Tax=uncultured Oscillibacter sp. TaxID=876091 RepID=UPI00260E0EF7|nr:N-acetylmuramoyl-L-alanine amidase [uncultured Oscillibacter sp.]
MVILLRKRDLVLSCLFCCFFLGLAAVLWRGSAVPAFHVRDEVPVTVVIDPGHGGEDGGAVSPGGVAESQINLAVSLRVSDLLRFTGLRTRLTRMEDVTICDQGLDTMRQRKTSDLKNRVKLVEETENAILLSIHQNSLPSSPVTHGAQVFWNRQEGAEALAESIQDALNTAVNAGNGKHPRQIPDSIYLMKHITAPGVLVECGFLSNTQETERLQDLAYQLRLAAAVTAGYLNAGAMENESGDLR